MMMVMRMRWLHAIISMRVTNITLFQMPFLIWCFTIYCIHRASLQSKFYLIFQMRKLWLPKIKYLIKMTYMFNGGVGLFITSKITPFTTTTCLSFQWVWNPAELYSTICSSMKFQGNLIITFCSDRCAALRRRGGVCFTSMSCCWLNRRL